MGSIKMSLELDTRPRKSIMKKLSELTSAEISTELVRRGQTVSETVGGAGDQENFLKLSTFLIDKGENIVSFEFETQETTTADDGKVIKLFERKKLIEKVVKLERYFSSERGL